MLTLAIIAATPATFAADFERARPGDTIRLGAGDYGFVQMSNRRFAPPLTIDAGTAARWTLRAQNVQGLVINGGIFGPARAPEALDTAARFALSRDITIHGAVFERSRFGLVIDRSSDIRISRAMLLRLTEDGINIALSQRVVVSDSRCESFVTGPPGHPDCIQLWSRPGNITSDVQLLRNVSIGDQQGFTAFNHVRNGIDDGGFDRVTMTGNYVLGSYPQGVALYDCRNCTVTDNIVETIPGSRFQTRVSVLRSSALVEKNRTGPQR